LSSAIGLRENQWRNQWQILWLLADGMRTADVGRVAGYGIVAEIWDDRKSPAAQSPRRPVT
jgi:hypothetical protein